jgi:hypothetical protein
VCARVLNVDSVVSTPFPGPSPTRTQSNTRINTRTHTHTHTHTPQVSASEADYVFAEGLVGHRHNTYQLHPSWRARPGVCHGAVLNELQASADPPADLHLIYTSFAPHLHLIYTSFASDIHRQVAGLQASARRGSKEEKEIRTAASSSHCIHEAKAHAASSSHWIHEAKARTKTPQIHYT